MDGMDIYHTGCGGRGKSGLGIISGTSIYIIDPLFLGDNWLGPGGEYSGIFRCFSDHKMRGDLLGKVFVYIIYHGSS
jgi:hypothetical protein